MERINKSTDGDVWVLAISFIRTIILFITIVVSMRVMGKRQMGELEPAEFVVAVIISDLTTHPLQDPGTPLLYGLIPVLTLVCCEILVSALVVKSVSFRAYICGKPSMIVENGKINQAEMKKNRFTLDELAEELRKNNITDISTVRHAVLETDGTLSTLLYPGEMPVTATQMNIQVDDPGYPMIVISDGRVLEKNLLLLGYNGIWLRNQLSSRNIQSVRDVFLMTADSLGRVYFAAKEAEK